MTKSYHKSQPGKGFFEWLDEVFEGDLKDFSQKLRNMGDEFRRDFHKDWKTRTVPRLNVIEGLQNYRVELAAPGLSKDNFKISLSGEHLKITANTEIVLSEEEKYVKREFDFGKFKRLMPLPEDADVNAIEARYENGLLLITIPRKSEEADGDEKEIKIS